MNLAGYRSQPDNPRHSEGSMVLLKDGRILLAYTEYYGGQSEDHSPARIIAAMEIDWFYQ